MKRLKASLIAFVVSSLICVPLLAFIKIGGEESVLNYILYVLIAAAAVLMLVFSLSSPEWPSFLPAGKKSTGAGMGAFIAALAYGAVGVYGFINPEKRLFGVVSETVETTVDISGEIVTQVSSTGRDSEVYSTIGIVYVAVMIVMAITFLFYAFGFFNGANYAGSYVMVPLIPILGAVVRVVLSFLDYTSSADMSANYLETLAMIAEMLFFVTSAKLTVGSAGSSSKWAIGTGSAAMFFILLRLVDPVIGIINKEQSILDAATGSHLATDLALVLFIAGYCVYVVNTNAEDYLEEIIEDEEDGYGGPVSSKPTLLTGSKRSRTSDDRYIPEIAMVTTVMPSAQTKAQGSQVAKSGTAYSAPVPPRRDGVTQPDRLRSRQREGYSAPVPPRRVPIGYRLEADELTTRGAGMQVADQFRVQRNEARRRTSNLLRYDGLDAFRAEMKGGRTALDVLESSRNTVEEDTSLIGIKPINPFQQSAEASAEPSVEPAEAQQMGEELQKEVEAAMFDVADRRKGGDRRKGENVGGRRSTDKQPETVVAAPDESAPEVEEEEIIVEEPENEYRDVKLAGGSLDSKMKKRRRAEQKNNMQQNPYQQNMNGMNMGMGMGYGMGMGMGYGMGMNNPYDPYAGMGMNNPYGAANNPYAANPYAAGMGQMPYGGDMYQDESEDYEDEYYYDDDYDVETADADEYDEYDAEYDGDYEDEYEDEEYYDDDDYVEYGDEYDDEYDTEYDEYGDDDEEYYDDDDGYGTYDMSAQGWQ